jgi:hypothetical protein
MYGLCFRAAETEWRCTTSPSILFGSCAKTDKKARSHGRSIEPVHGGWLLVLLAALLRVGGELLMVVRVERLTGAFEALNCTLVNGRQITGNQWIQSGALLAELNSQSVLTPDDPNKT